jgi:hypothetical protein
MAPIRDLSPSRVVASLAEKGFFDLMAPGLYAWGVTVAWPASQRLAPFPARILAGAALAALVAGAVLTRFWPLGARVTGIWLFLGASIGTWAFLSRSIDATHLDPVHGLLGAVGWAAFALVWGGERAQRDGDAGAARVLPWPDARRRSALIMAVVGTAAAVPLALAWWVEGTERALFAHAVALAAAVALVARAADLAAPLPGEAGPGAAALRPQKRLLAAAIPLTALAGLALAGALLSLLR